MQDKISKGRRNGGGPAFGERNGSSKLTAAKVLEIRALYKQGLTEREIAEWAGISKSQAHRVVAMQNWKSQPDSSGSGAGKEKP